ncbi:hypothetical protein ACHAWF_000185, partial [Thalassiosira exigua]
KQRRPVSDFASLDNVYHPAKRLLHFYKHRGAPVKFSTPPWTRRQVKHALARGPHKSSLEYLDFLREEFVAMISKGQWITVPAHVARDLPASASPPLELFPSVIAALGGYVTTAGGMSIMRPSPWRPWNHAVRTCPRPHPAQDTPVEPCLWPSQHAQSEYQQWLLPGRPERG